MDKFNRRAETETSFQTFEFPVTYSIYHLIRREFDNSKSVKYSKKARTNKKSEVMQDKNGNEENESIIEKRINKKKLRR